MHATTRDAAEVENALHAPESGPTWRQIGARLARPTVELYSALSLLGWAALLLLAPALFERGPSYAAMRVIADESVWGIGMGCLGLAQLLAIATREPAFRLTGCGGAASAWMFIAIMLAQTNGVKTGTVVYGLLSLFLLWRNLRPET